MYQTTIINNCDVRVACISCIHVGCRFKQSQTEDVRYYSCQRWEPKTCFSQLMKSNGKVSPSRYRLLSNLRKSWSRWLSPEGKTETSFDRECKMRIRQIDKIMNEIPANKRLMDPIKVTHKLKTDIPMDDMIRAAMHFISDVKFYETKQTKVITRRNNLKTFLPAERRFDEREPAKIYGGKQIITVSVKCDAL